MSFFVNVNVNYSALYEPCRSALIFQTFDKSNINSVVRLTYETFMSNI